MIKLIVLDVDGCLTDGHIVYTNSYEESKSFNVKDGLGIKSWMCLGGEVAIITGRRSKIVEYRAKELGIQHLYQGVGDKLGVLTEILQKSGFSFEETAAIGDDMNDYKMLIHAAKSFTPSDGVKEIQEIVTYVLQTKGGQGVVREMIDILLRDNGQLEAFKALWI
jgi:3-deoxy-D-manno-octulosonate 8-phosphate phosphatase (KDO 8-P phosphatase)